MIDIIIVRAGLITLSEGRHTHTCLALLEVTQLSHSRRLEISVHRPTAARAIGSRRGDLQPCPYPSMMQPIGKPRPARFGDTEAKWCAADGTKVDGWSALDGSAVSDGVVAGPPPASWQSGRPHMDRAHQEGLMIMIETLLNARCSSADNVTAHTGQSTIHNN